MQDRLQYLVFRVFVDHLDSMVPRVNLDPGPVPFFLDFNQHWYGSKPDRPTTFRARSFCPSFIYLLTTRSIPQIIILSLFPYRLCPSLNRGVARFFKKGSQRQTKGTHQIVIYRPSRRVLPIITLHNNAYKGGVGGGGGNRRHVTWVPKNPREIPQLRPCYTMYPLFNPDQFLA